MGGPWGQELPKAPKAEPVMQPSPITGDNHPWFVLAKKTLGEREILGTVDNQWILDCFKHTSYKAGHDEVPWCAAFVCRMLEECGYKSTHSAAAASYDDFGLACSLKEGAIITFKWASGGRHVTICDHVIDGQMVACIGGNQSNSVKISNYERQFIHSIRWPQL